MKYYNVSEDLLNSLANYLSQRPWGEVNNFIVELKKAVTLTVEQAPATDVAEEKAS